MDWAEWHSWGRQQYWYKDWIKFEFIRLFKETFMLIFPDLLPDPPKRAGTTGREAFQQLQISGSKYKCSRDSKWWYTTVNEIKRFLKWYRDPLQPESQFNDCDNYAKRCSGIMDFWAPGSLQGRLDLQSPMHERDAAYALDEETGKVGWHEFEPRGFTLTPIATANIRFLDV